LCSAKPLTNGLNPLSGLWARENSDFTRGISARLDPLRHSPPTHWAPPSLLEAIHMMEEESYEVLTRRKGAYFLEQNTDLYNDGIAKVIGDTGRIGLALRIEIAAKQGLTVIANSLDRIFVEGMKANLDARGRKIGLVLDVGGYYKNVLYGSLLALIDEARLISRSITGQLIRPVLLNGQGKG